MTPRPEKESWPKCGTKIKILCLLYVMLNTGFIPIRFAAEAVDCHERRICDGEYISSVNDTQLYS